MATRSIVPRANGEGSIGTESKAWGALYVGSLTTRLNSKAYAVGAVVFAGSLPPGLILQCMTAGTTAATEPDFSGATVGGTVTDGTVVWTYMPLGTLSREITPAFNKRDVITTSGTYTAHVTGWYRIVVKGGGGGGRGADNVAQNTKRTGSGGGEGGTTIAYERMTAGETAAVVIGAGGAGGAAGGGAGGAGGDSTVTINGNIYTGGGGKDSGGGAGTIPGASGGAPIVASSSYTGSVRGANGGGQGGSPYPSKPAVEGGGGYGGNYVNGTSHETPNAGGAGGDGYVWFEYFDPTI